VTLHFREFIEIGLPTVERVATVTFVTKNSNPITVYLSDGTNLHFNIDEFRRIGGEPAPGKKVKVVFQRHPGDRSATPSKIQSVTVL
jgi:hypothetical protein